MKTTKLFTAACCCIIALVGCSKEIISDEENQLARTSQLSITTRADGDLANIKDGRIYVFNQAGTCIEMLTTAEATQSATTLLAPGTYQVYAVGSEDLNRFSLPDKDNAKADRKISLNEGNAMEDFLTTQAQVTLEDGVTQQLNLHMERKVTSLTSITIKKVPTDVTAVSVTIEPLYSSILLDGSFPNETEPAKMVLTKKEDGTWQTTPNMLHFPSKGKPTITITFTREDGLKSYSYTANEELAANHHFTIEGTYTQSQGVTLTGIIYNSEWGEDKTITFDFDDENISDNGGDDDSGNTDVTMPTPGSTYKGCYVVSVNGNTATLLSNNQKRGYTLSNDNTTATNSLNEALASWPSEDEITGTWRIPTLEEAQLFLIDSNSFELTLTSWTTYIILNNSNVEGIDVKNTASGRVLGSSTPLNDLGTNAWLRPVIDVTVE
ncbi:MAG: FimB/Mfa2 family fimbrial subunit [Prevotella sp.]|nr:FimB/Mfa2 family fimbrial subunit [Prevotella sp.]